MVTGNETLKQGLSLTPNVISGYSIVPDQWNWTVVVKKIHGVDSKHAGVEYKQPLSYHKNLDNAVEFLYSHVAKTEGESKQKEEFEKTGKIADIEKLLEAFLKAKEEVKKSLEELRTNYPHVDTLISKRGAKEQVEQVD